MSRTCAKPLRCTAVVLIIGAPERELLSLRRLINWLQLSAFTALVRAQLAQER